MKKTFLFALAANLLLTPCYANFVFVSRVEGGCEQIPGRWTGTAKAYHWMLGECIYHGEGKVSELDAAGNFTLAVSGEKNSGSFICPQHTDTKLNGVCVGELVVFATEYGNLNGSYANKVGDAKGSLNVSPGINVDLEIQFQSGD